MKILDGQQEAYEAYKQTNSSDPYSARVVSYGEDWANLMEERIEQGEKLEDVAKETSHIADTDGITGFMYGCAVQGLAQFWLHGEALRKWHNGEYGVESKSGVVNPAIITINP